MRNHPRFDGSCSTSSTLVSHQRVHTVAYLWDVHHRSSGKPSRSRHPFLSVKSARRLEYFLSSSHACPSWLDRNLRSPLPPKQATLQLLKSSATSSILPSCWHFSLFLIGKAVWEQRISLPWSTFVIKQVGHFVYPLTWWRHFWNIRLFN